MLERLADPLDVATDYAQRLNDVAISNHKARTEQSDKSLMIEGMECCRDCAGVIPSARLQALPNAARCADCQSKYERSLKNGR